MHLRFDPRANAAYLYLRDQDEQVKVVHTTVVAPPGSTDLDEGLRLDFDDEGRLVGIELLVPEHQLLPSVLRDAQPYPR